MNRTKLYAISSLVLLILNIIIIAFFMTGKGHGPKQKPKTIIVNRLDFSKDQVIQYEVLIEDHISKITAIEEKIKANKKLLYANLIDQNSNYTDSIIIVLGNLQTKIEQINFDHFREIKAICEPNQLPKFESLTHELGKIFHGKRPPKGKK